MTWRDINFSVPLTKDDKLLLKKQKMETTLGHSYNDTSNIDLSLTVSNVGNKTMKKILTNINGFAKPKEMVCIMGASGSGKTSLLNFLAQRLALSPGAVPEGEVRCNNRIVSPTDFGKIGAFVQQDDVLIETMSARESFTFSAKLRTNLPAEKIDERVEMMI